MQATVSILGRETILTDEEGRFFLCVDANEELETEIKHKDYHPYSRIFPVPEWDNATFFELKIFLDPLFKLPVYSEIIEPDSPTFISRLKPKSGKKDQFVLYFDFDKTDPKTESLENFNQFITAHFAEREPAFIEIIGFSDQQGGDAYNVELSEKRAEAVGVYLKQKGIMVDDIRLEGKGKNQSDEANWKNRKVEVIVYLSE
ncbi:MAG: OmpA family protein [Saprospiraceae bacterium]